jgi:hypothetical protein
MDRIELEKKYFGRKKGQADTTATKRGQQHTPENRISLKGSKYCFHRFLSKLLQGC